jgi:hypothetical protein
MIKRITASLVLLCVCAVLLAQTGSRRPAGTAIDQQTNLSTSPPVAERVAIRLLAKETATANAILYVQYEQTRPAPQTLQLTVDDKTTVTLRDDGIAPDDDAGDAIHSAFFRVDVKELRAQQQRMLNAGPLPIFVGREIVGTATATLSSTPLAFKDLPLFPNRATFRRGKPVAMQLRFAAIGPGLLAAVYPQLAVPVASDASRSLIITNTAVVNNKKRTYNPCRSRIGAGQRMGNWTFGHLMAEMADGAGIPRADFVRRWLDTWRSDQTVNSFNVPARPDIGRILGQWDNAGDNLLLANAPFRLVAIVNRVDLGGNRAYGGGEAGELRFVFALTDPDTCETVIDRTFLVIFEYKVPRRGCERVRAWAQQWKDLESFSLFGENYNAALEAITLQVTEAGTNPAQTPNQSSLGQIRTNEVAFDTPWELREFRLGTNGYLFQDTVAQTPDLSLNNTQLLSDYARSNDSDIVRDDYTLPKLIVLEGRRFRGGAAPLPGNDAEANTVPLFFWDGPSPSPSATLSYKPDLRHHLSLNTCNGCHGEETGAIFTHVDETGRLSGFLTGITVTDPAGEGVDRSFGDLERRARRMKEILTKDCWQDVYFDPVRTIH